MAIHKISRAAATHGRFRLDLRNAFSVHMFDPDPLRRNFHHSPGTSFCECRCYHSPAVAKPVRFRRPTMDASGNIFRCAASARGFLFSQPVRTASCCISGTMWDIGSGGNPNTFRTAKGIARNVPFLQTKRADPTNYCLIHYYPPVCTGFKHDENICVTGEPGIGT